MSTSRLSSQLHALEDEELELLVQADLTEQLVRILHCLHRETGRFPLLFNKRTLAALQASAAAEFSLDATTRPRQEDLATLFEAVPEARQAVLARLGFGLELKPTSLADPRASTGVFLRVKDAQPLPAGSLLGFVPGLYSAPPLGAFELSARLVFRPTQQLFRIDEPLPCPNEGHASVQALRARVRSGE